MSMRGDVRELARIVDAIEAAARELVERSMGIQAVERNAQRILASTRMLQINVNDLLDADGDV
jgi:hypothetical protein